MPRVGAVTRQAQQRVAVVDADSRAAGGASHFDALLDDSDRTALRQPDPSTPRHTSICILEHPIKSLSLRNTRRVERSQGGAIAARAALSFG
jgi:hypothetical protein